MAELTEGERLQLAMHTRTCEQAGEHWITGSRAIADTMRQDLPDLDDVTIAKVMLAFGNFLLDAVPINPELAQTSLMTTYAAAQLASAELRIATTEEKNT